MSSPDAESAAHSIHPDIVPLLESMQYPKDGVTRVPDAVLQRVERTLQSSQDDEAFFDLLAVWHRLHLASVKPAADQLLKLVKLFPQVRDARSAADVARFASRALKDSRIPGGKAGVAVPRGGGIGMRKGPR